MRERDFQNWLVGAARALGWKVWHVPAPMRWDSRGGKGFVGASEAAGLADLILVGAETVLFVEVKGPKGKLSSKQEEFLAAVNESSARDVYAYVFRPGDEEEVEAVLRARFQEWVPQEGC